MGYTEPNKTCPVCGESGNCLGHDKISGDDEHGNPTYKTQYICAPESYGGTGCGAEWTER